MRRIVEPNTDERFLVLGERREPPLHHSSGDGCNGSWDVNYAHCGDINSLLAASRYLLCHATWPTWPWSICDLDLDLDFGCWILAQIIPSSLVRFTRLQIVSSVYRKTFLFLGVDVCVVL
jgi:hypothetical protein